MLKRASRVCAEVCVRALPAEVLHCGCVTVDSDWNLVLCVCACPSALKLFCNTSHKCVWSLSVSRPASKRQRIKIVLKSR